MKWARSFILIHLLSMATISSAQNKQNEELLTRLLAADPRFDSVLRHKEDWNVQVIYTTVDHKKKKKPALNDHYFNLDDDRYYYPASTVKLPIVLLSLQRLHELNVPGLDMNSTMISGKVGDFQTAVNNDPSAPDGRPTIAHYIRKILLVSDNDAFNRLYEFLGQEYINRTLQKMGYRNAEIIHRLDISLSEEENRKTNPVYFYDTSGRLLYTKPAEYSEYIYASRNNALGRGYRKNGELINGPMDFSKKNRLPLSVLHSMVRSIIYPHTVPKEKRFNLSSEDLAFVKRYMSMTPQESAWPKYDSSEYWDTYVKFLFYGAQKNASLPDIRIYNKTGDAYGFLIDGAYFTDTKNNIEFFLSAVIYCNSDGILNDDHYDYETIGLPFMKALGRLVYEQELGRNRPSK